MSISRYLILAAGGAGFAGSAEAALTICNDTEFVQSVTIGYEGPDDWLSKGWWNIEPDDCAVVVGGNLQKRYYYIRAEVNGGDFAGEGFMFCTTPQEFEIQGDANCEARGYDNESFREIDTGQTATDYTYRLVTSGGGAPPKDDGPGTGNTGETGLSICNETADVQSVSIGYENSEGFISEGWWNIDPDDCAKVLGGKLQQRYYYYRAEVSGGPFEGEGYMFCTSPEVYSIQGDSNCEARGYDTESFSEIDTGPAAQGYTFYITSDGTPPPRNDDPPPPPRNDDPPPANTDAGLRVCNETEYTQSLTIGFEGREDWTSKGWWNIEPGDCVNPSTDGTNRRFLFYHVSSSGGEFVGENYYFCIDSEPFVIVGDTNCGARGYERAAYREIDTGGTTGTYTLTLLESEIYGTPATPDRDEGPGEFPEADGGPSQDDGDPEPPEFEFDLPDDDAPEGPETEVTVTDPDEDAGPVNETPDTPESDTPDSPDADDPFGETPPADDPPQVDDPPAFEDPPAVDDPPDNDDDDAGGRRAVAAQEADAMRITGPITGSALLAGALWLGGAGLAAADLRICNDTELVQSIAIGFKGPDDWMSQGWWNIDPGDCTTVIDGDLKQRFYYYFSDNGETPFQGQDFFFCANNEIFDIVGDTDCEGRGYETLSMREIDTGETARNFTLTLVDDGGRPSGGDKTPGGGTGAGDGSGGAPDGTPLNETVQDTTIVPPDQLPMTVSMEDLVTEIPAGNHGKGFETIALFQGCELVEGKDFCAFHAGDWKMRVYYRGPTPERLMYALEELQINMPVLLKGDMVETRGNIAAIVVRGVVPKPGEDADAQLRAAMQGDWIDDGDRRWEMTVLGSEVHYRQDGAYSASRFFRIARECDGSRGQGPVMVQINSENNRRTCYTIGRADGNVLELTDVRRGRTTLYRRLR